MNQYEQIKAQWINTIEEKGHVFESQLLKAGSFCVFFCEWESGGCPCEAPLAETLFFDDPQTALAFLRFSAIPYVLDCDSEGDMDDCSYVPAEQYLDRYESGKRALILKALQMLDTALNADTVAKAQLCAIRQAFNDAFGLTDPRQEILTWGKLPEFLKDPCFTEAFAQAIAEEDKMNRDEGPVAGDGTREDPWLMPAGYLKELLDKGKFDENNPEHRELAETFLEECDEEL